MRKRSVAIAAAVAAGLAASACSTDPIVAPVPEAALAPALNAEPADWRSLLPEQLAAVRAAAARYRDVAVAESEGWKPFGGEAPLMGQHYSREGGPDYVLGQRIDFSRPSNLLYADVDGVRRLTGVAYVVRIAELDPMPAGFAGPRDVWHVHNVVDLINAITEDRPLMRGAARWFVQSRFFDKGDVRGRLAMVHVWTEHANPDGDFADFDRTLPYRKLGLPAAWAAGTSLDTARGAHLATENGCEDTFGFQAWIANVGWRQKRTIMAACEAGAAEVRAAMASDPATFNAAAASAYARFAAVRDSELTADQQRRIAALVEERGCLTRGG